MKEFHELHHVFHHTGECGGICPRCEFHPKEICGQNCLGCCNEIETAS